MAISALLLSGGCSSHGNYEALQESLNEYVEGKDANIGVAVIIDGVDTVAVNGHKKYPMLSVYKFPIALALADHYRKNNMPYDSPIAVLPADLHQDTYSPMTEKILASGKLHADTLMMPAGELLEYMLQQSDNNASDIVLKSVGGADYVERYLKRIGMIDIHVRSSEAEMYADTSLCYDNSSTPICMASLIDKFDMDYNDYISVGIKQLMETCETGTNRLAKPLRNAEIGHKTGTGFTLSNGRLMAVNDAGYVHLPDGHRYAIAVFIENSGYDMTHTEELIADISEIVMTHVK